MRKPLLLPICSVVLLILVSGAARATQLTWEEFLADAEQALKEERVEDAEAAFRQALEEMQSFETADPLRSRATTGLALSLIELDRSEEAVLPFEEGIEVYRDVPVESLRKIADAVCRVGNDLYRSSVGIDAQPRNAKRATRLFRVAVALYEELDGPNSRNVEIVLDRLQSSMMGHGELVERVSLARRVVAIAEKRYGTNGPELFHPLFQLAEVVYWSDKKESEELRVRIFRLYEEHHADNLRIMIGAYRMMAGHYQSTRETEQARYWTRKADKAFVELVPKEKRELPKALIGRAVSALNAGEEARAEKFFTRALEAARRTENIEVSDFTYVLNSVVSWHKNQGRYDRAEELLQEALARASSIAGENPEQLFYALGNLSHLEILRGNLDAALEYRLEATNVSSRLTSEEKMRSLSALADLYIRKMEYEAALENALESLVFFEEKYGPEHRMTSHATQRVADAYLGLQDFEQARVFLLRTIHSLEKLGPENSLLKHTQAQYDLLIRNQIGPTK